VRRRCSIKSGLFVFVAEHIREKAETGRWDKTTLGPTEKMDFGLPRPMSVRERLI